MELNETEIKIIQILREARPFEKVEILKDQMGRPNSYLITRTEKIVIREEKAKILFDKAESKA